MKYRDFGKLGIKGSAFGLGCMRFNGTASGDSIIDEQKAICLIRRAIDGGVTYLDTAYVYLERTSETVLGKALRDGYRERVTIATKMPSEYVHNRADMEALLEEELHTYTGLIVTEDGPNSEVILRIKRSITRDIFWIVTSNSLAYMTPDYHVATIQRFPYPNNYDLYEKARVKSG